MVSKFSLSYDGVGSILNSAEVEDMLKSRASEIASSLSHLEPEDISVDHTDRARAKISLGNYSYQDYLRDGYGGML